MLKRFVMIGLLGISASGMLRTAEAHYVPTLAGWAWHSVQCSVELKSVPSPTAHPAKVECKVVTGVIESLCVNPQGHFGFGTSTKPVTLIGSGTVEDNDVTDKEMGIAHVDVIVGTADGKPNDPPLDNRFCKRNWTNVANLIRSFTTEIKVYKCLDGDLCQNLLEVSKVETGGPCTLDAQYSLEGFDIGTDPFNPDNEEDCPNCPPPGTAYVCPNPVLTHVN